MNMDAGALKSGVGIRMSIDQAPIGCDGRRKPKKSIRAAAQVTLVGFRKGDVGEPAERENVQQRELLGREKLPIKPKKKISVKDYINIINLNQEVNDQPPLDPLNQEQVGVSRLDLAMIPFEEKKQARQTALDLAKTILDLSETSSNTEASSNSQDSEDPDWMTLESQEVKKSELDEESELEDTENEEEEDSMQEAVVEGEEGTSENKANMEAKKTVPSQKKGKGKSPEVVDGNGKEASRQLVDGNHVWKLVHDYWRHFNEFSKGRKKTEIQIVPNKVWKLVYADYMMEFPQSTFSKCILKEHLRKLVIEMKSGVNNPEGGQTTIVQDEELMVKLMETKSWKSQNILKVRQVASTRQIPHMDFETTQVSTGSQPPPQSTPTTPTKPNVASGSTSASRPASTIVPGQTPPSAGAPSLPKPKVPQNGKPLTKSQNLKRAGEHIASVLSEFKSMKQDGVHVALDPSKKSVNEAKAAFFASRKVESDARAKEAAARAEGQL